jgi:rubredoxin
MVRAAADGEQGIETRTKWRYNDSDRTFGRPARRSAQRRKDRPMDKWQCLLCGYIYDPEVGDPTQGIAPGTAFEDLPSDWECPDCGASKDEFERMA